jgi:hypothetical protein
LNLKIALLALVAFGPGATAASITATPYTVLTEPAPTIASTILSALGDPGLSGYDYLVVATPGLAISTPDTSSQIPAAALGLSVAIAISFCTILGWQRLAIRPGHRVFSHRRKRILRKMSHI